MENGQPGIYVASKTKHAARWKGMRASGTPIISTWIDLAIDKAKDGAVDHADLWDRCIEEAASSTAVVVYFEEGEVFKGAYVEVGAALASKVPVFLVGDPSGTCWGHRLVTRCATVEEAFKKAFHVWLDRPVMTDQEEPLSTSNAKGDRVEVTS